MAKTQAMELAQKLLPPADASHEDRLRGLIAARNQLLETQLALSSLWHFNTRVLASDPAKIRVLQDPQVRAVIDAQSAHYVQWLKDRTHDRALDRDDTTPRKVTAVRRAMLIVPRRIGKSTNVTETLPILGNCWDSELSTAICAATRELSLKFTASTRAHWEGLREGSRLEELFGRYCPGPGVSARPWNTEVAVTLARRDLTRHDPTLMNYSVATGITGGHPDVIVMDDPITEEKLNEGRETWMRKVRTAYKSLGMVLNPDGYFLLVCTRYGADDLVGHIIRTEIEPAVRDLVQVGAPKGELPADFQRNWHRYAHLAGWHVIHRSCEYDLEGNPTASFFPIAWTPEDIQLEKRKNPVFAAAQLNNMPGDEETNPIKEAHIRQCLITRAEVPQEAYSFLSLHGDWAFKSVAAQTVARGDSNVLFACARYRGNVYVVKGWHSRTATMHECAEQVVEFVRWAWDVSKFPGDPARRRFRFFTYDKDTGQHGSANTTREFFKGRCHDAGVPMPFTVPMIRGAGQNNKARMYGVAGFWQEPRIFLVEGVPGVDEACAQMLTISSTPFDDHASALADAFAEEAGYTTGPRRTEPRGPRVLNHTALGFVDNEAEGLGPYPWASSDPFGLDTVHPGSVTITRGGTRR